MRGRYLCSVSCLLLAWIACLLVFGGEDPPQKTADGQQICVTGTVYRQEWKQSGQRLYLKDISFASQTADIPPKTEEWNKKRVLVYLKEDADVRIGSRVVASGICRYPQKARNPGCFDAKNYYDALGIPVFLQKAKIIRQDAAVYPVCDAISRFQYLCRRQLARIGEDADAGILSAMLLGDRGMLPDEIEELYQDAGIIHLLAVSGLHISLTGMALYRLLRRIGLSFVSCAAVCGSIMAAYACMAGSVSAVRAVLMFLLFLLSQVTGRTGDLPTNLAAAAAAIVLAQNAQLTQAGFLLSFGAVCGVILSGAWESRPLRKTAFGVNLGVQLTTLPLTAFFYYQFPLYAVPVNLCVVWITPFVLGFGMAGLFASAFSLELSRFLLAPAHYLLAAAECICKYTRLLPCASVVTGKPDVWRMVFFYAALAGAVFAKRKCGARLLKKTGYADAAALFLACLFLAALFARTDRGFYITFLDVGQGDGCCIQNEARSVWMADGGSSSEEGLADYCLEPFLKSRGIRRVDYWMISHGDLDHVSGLLEILRSYVRGMDGENAAGITIGTILLPEGDYPRNTETLREIETLAAAQKIAVRRVQKGTEVRDGNLTVSFLAPDANIAYEDANAACAVAQISYGSFRALLTGDVQGNGETALLNSGLLRDTDVLKAAHHGSRGSTFAQFLEAVKPELTVISCGQNNRYGHPHEETLGRLADAKSEVMRTDIAGAVQIRVTQNGYTAAGTL